MSCIVPQRPADAQQQTATCSLPADYVAIVCTRPTLQGTQIFRSPRSSVPSLSQGDISCAVALSRASADLKMLKTGITAAGKQAFRASVRV